MRLQILVFHALLIIIHIIIHLFYLDASPISSLPFFPSPAFFFIIIFIIVLLSFLSPSFRVSSFTHLSIVVSSFPSIHDCLLLIIIVIPLYLMCAYVCPDRVSHSPLFIHPWLFINQVFLHFVLCFLFLLFFFRLCWFFFSIMASCMCLSGRLHFYSFVLHSLLSPCFLLPARGDSPCSFAFCHFVIYLFFSHIYFLF